MPENRKPYNYTQKHNSQDNSSVEKSLYRGYYSWYKTPYRYGGESKRGVDCSFLVKSIYRSEFDIRLPRTTKEQVKIGYWVDKKELKAGDLVFFKTSYSSRHVGIYLHDDKFINASTKYGVVLSSLNNSYWRSHYWKAKRILD